MCFHVSGLPPPTPKKEQFVVNQRQVLLTGALPSLNQAEKNRWQSPQIQSCPSQLQEGQTTGFSHCWSLICCLSHTHWAMRARTWNKDTGHQWNVQKLYCLKSVIFCTLIEKAKIHTHEHSFAYFQWYFKWRTMHRGYLEAKHSHLNTTNTDIYFYITWSESTIFLNWDKLLAYTHSIDILTEKSPKSKVFEIILVVCIG